MRIKISGVANDSIVDGAGFRLTVFTQGCHHNCPILRPMTQKAASGLIQKIF